MATNLFNSNPVLAITITDKNGAQRRMHFTGAEIAVGRLDDNDLVLPKNNVSKRHARVLYSDGRCVVSDLQSTNGTYVNGRRINAPVAVNDGDKIYIGDYILSLCEVSEAEADMPPPLPDLSPKDEEEPLANGQRPPALDFRTVASPSPLPPPLPTSGARGQVPLVPPRTASAAPTQLNATQLNRPLRMPGAQQQPFGRMEHTEIQRPPRSMPPAPPPPVPNGVGGIGAPALPSAVTQTMPRQGAPIGHANVEVPHAANDDDDDDDDQQTPEPLTPRPAATPVPAATTSAASTSAASTSAASTSAASTSAASTGPKGAASPISGRSPESRSSAPPSMHPTLTPTVRLQGALANLVERLTDQRNGDPGELGTPASDYLDQLDTAIGELAREGIIGPDLDRRFLREATINELTGLGPLERLLRDDHTRRIVVDHPTRILVDYGKGLLPANAFFSSARAINLVARRLLARGRVSLLPQQELHEATLPEGDHVLVLSSPLVHPGPVIAIRCARRAPVESERLVREGLLSGDTLRILRDAVQTRRNVLVYGAADVDLSLTLSGLAALAAHETRLLAIETSPGLAIAHPQVLTLSHHNADLDYGTLLQRAAHFACEHVIVDDIKMHATRPVLAWASHARGVLMGLSTNGQASGLQQLRSALLMSGHQDGEGLHHLITRAVQLTVEVRKERDGQLRVVRVNEVTVRDGQMPEERPLFTLHNGIGGGRPSFLPE